MRCGCGRHQIQCATIKSSQSDWLKPWVLYMLTSVEPAKLKSFTYLILSLTGINGDPIGTGMNKARKVVSASNWYDRKSEACKKVKCLHDRVDESQRDVVGFCTVICRSANYSICLNVLNFRNAEDGLEFYLIMVKWRLQALTFNYEHRDIDMILNFTEPNVDISQNIHFFIQPQDGLWSWWRWIRPTSMDRYQHLEETQVDQRNSHRSTGCSFYLDTVVF